MWSKVADDKQKILDRIDKLLSLADPERGGTEAEREAAEKQAQKLIFKHRIDLMELRKHREGNDPSGALVITEEYSKSGVVEAQFYAKIYHAFGGRAVIQKLDKGRQRWTFILVEDSYEMVQAIADRLWRWLKLEHGQAKREALPMNPNAFRRAFYANAGEVIFARLKLQEEYLAKQAGAVGTDLVRLDSAITQRKQEELFGGGLRAGKRRGYGNQDGIQAGTTAGRKADISKGAIRE